MQGAKAVQVGTCHWTEGPSCFDRISSELEVIMKNKGYNSLEEFRGKLKPYSRSGSGSKATREKAADRKDRQTGFGLEVLLCSIGLALVAIFLASFFGLIVVNI